MILSIVKELEEIINNFDRSLHIKNLHVMFNMNSLMPWPIIILVLFCVSCIIALSSMISSFWKANLVIGLLLLLITAINIGLNIWIHVRRRNEIIHRIMFLIDLLKDVSFEEIVEEFSQFLDDSNDTAFLTLPSHSFTMMHLKTKNAPIPFPTSLLQTSDTIGLCSGQVSPCQATCNYDGCLTLERGEVFSKDMLGDDHVQITQKNDFYKFNVLRSPIAEEISSCLVNSTQYPTIFNRPKSMLTKNRESSMLSFLYVAIPIACVAGITITTVWNLLATCEGDEIVSLIPFFMEYNDPYDWFELYVVSLVLSILPLLPILTPLLWTLLYLTGEAKTLVHCLKPQRKDAYSLDKEIKWWHLFFKLLKGGKSFHVLSAGVFDSLGSITALCCFDKEGILSWFHPMPEKLGFLSNLDDTSPEEDSSSEIEEQSTLEQSLSMQKQFSEHLANVKLEVLNLSQNVENAKLQFDDHNWSRHITSLKPFGLSIYSAFLVNVDFTKDASLLSDDCKHMFNHKLIKDLKKNNNAAQYESFQKILSEQRKQLYLAASLMDCNLPDTERLRHGLKSLTKLIGFADETSLLYTPKVITTGYKKSLSYVGQKKPVYLHSVVDVTPGKSCLDYVQGVTMAYYLDPDINFLMTIGSGDFLFNLCSHYWDGNDVMTLDETNRKKIVDFSHRNSITGSCVACTFRPITSNLPNPSSYVGLIDEESQSKFPCDQIFLGMVALQYQPRKDVLRLIDALDGASVRFVHFSPDEEFKSRVFAEKIGLEVGWNCNISLADHRPSSPEVTTPQDSIHSDIENLEEFAEDEPSSALLNKSPQTPLSESSFSDSAFYQQNRAKLPRGIENIVPHIEQVDNVPLLVPLFTDCDQKSMKEMVSVMQRYGEVVCCIGSSECVDNLQVFAEADISIAIQPIVTPHQTNKSSSFHESFSFSSNICMNPIESNQIIDASDFSTCKLMVLARNFNTFPCSVTLVGSNCLSVIYNMIKQARHSLFLSTICLVFIIKSQLMVTILQIITLLLHLPPIFTAIDVAWLSYIINPLLSFSLLASPQDGDLMTWAPLKNMSKQSSLREVVATNMKRFATKFLPSCVVVALLYLFCMLSICEDLHTNVLTNYTRFNSSNTFIQCYPCFSLWSNTTLSNNSRSFIQDIVFQHRVASQQLCLCAFVLFLSVISSGYVHRWKSIRHVSPLTNKIWGVAVVITLILQVIYSILTITANSTSNYPSFLGIMFYKTIILTLLLVWPIPLLIINEVAKIREIKVWNRNQKRARLAFGTKLGMNSPF